VVGAGGGQLGSLESGVLASLTSPAVSVLAGGLLTIAGAVAIGIALPAFRRYAEDESGAAAAGRKPAGPDAGPEAGAEPGPETGAA
jgi:hypothetical protein